MPQNSFEALLLGWTIGYVIGTLVFATLLGLIPAVIARNKGRDFVTWWVYGAAIFIVALPHALLMRTDSEAVERIQVRGGQKKCPYCAELIKEDARVCRFCGNDLIGGHLKCPFCSESIPAQVKKCPHCREEWG